MPDVNPWTNAVILEGVRSRPKCRCDAFGTLADPLAERAAAWRERW